MSRMPQLTRPKILENLEKRWREKIVYTLIGDIVTSVNPFCRPIDSEGPELTRKYLADNVKLNTPSELPPHIYTLVAKALLRMQQNDCSQSILISGESGAGKTEATKLVIAHLGDIVRKAAASGKAAASRVGIAERVKESSPIMEPIGNARTVRNDNSSRFGKHIDVQFDTGGRSIIGARTNVYLLEKPRVCEHDKGERNYHIFYMLMTGAPEEVRRSCRLQGTWESYSIMKRADGTTQAVVQTWDDAAEWANMLEALDKLGLQQDESMKLFRLVACVLHVGNLSIVEDAAGATSAARVQNLEQLQIAAELMQIAPADKLARAICYQTKYFPGEKEPIATELNEKKAKVARDSLCRHLYQLTFDWCVERVNKALAGPSVSVAHCVGILDIFGFENFGFNSLPQLCINLTNERLHALFIEHVFKLEQQVYAEEDVEYERVEYEGNEAVIELIDKPKGVCIFSILKESTTLGSGTDAAFLGDLHKAFGGAQHKKVYFKPPNDGQFGVHHYATRGERGQGSGSPVIYTVKRFREKNGNSLSPDIMELLERGTSWLDVRVRPSPLGLRARACMPPPGTPPPSLHPSHSMSHASAKPTPLSPLYPLRPSPLRSTHSCKSCRRQT